MTLKTLWMFAFDILESVCQALVSKMNISPLTSEWSHIFIIAIMTAKPENCLSCSLIKMFWVHVIPWPVGDILRSSFFFIKISYFDKMPSK